MKGGVSVRELHEPMVRVASENLPKRCSSAVIFEVVSEGETEYHRFLS